MYVNFPFNVYAFYPQKTRDFGFNMKSCVICVFFVKIISPDISKVNKKKSLVCDVRAGHKCDMNNTNIDEVTNDEYNMDFYRNVGKRKKRGVKKKLI